MSFEVGKSYNDAHGHKYTCLSIDNGVGTFQFNNVVKKLRIIPYCGVDAVIQYGEILFRSAKVVPYFDEEFDLPPKPKVEVTINKNNEGYINVFKKHRFVS